MKAEGARLSGCDRGRCQRRRHCAGRRLRRRALLAGGRPAGRRRPASRKRLELRDPRRAAAALRHRGDAGAARRAGRALCAALRDRARRQLPRRRRAAARVATTTAPCSARCSAAATGSGSPATTIPSRCDDLGGISAAMFAIGPLVFRHAPEREDADGEIAGHLHPVARVNGRGRTVSRRCFATDGKRMVMPAFGAYAGGLNMRDARLRRRVRHAQVHRAYAGRGRALRHRGAALPGRLGRAFIIAQIEGPLSEASGQICSP